MHPLLKLYSQLPNWRGKLFLGNKLFLTAGYNQGIEIQKMVPDFLMELNLADRMQRLMYIKRIYESETSNALKPLLKNARCFVDIGANVGYFSMLAKAINPHCQVISIEPLPQNLEKLHKHKEINKFSNFEILDVCISDQPGSTEFLIPPQDECGWGRIAYKDLFDGHRIVRNVETLDRIVEKLKIKNIDLIKIDIEGFELKALHGMTKTIDDMQPSLCIELNEVCLTDLGTSGKEILSWLKKRDYNLFFLDRSGKLHPTETTIEPYEFLNYIAIPNSKTATYS